MEEQAAELEALNDELSASEARLRGIVDSSLDAIVTTDSESRILEWNHHAEAVFGWTAEEAVGRTLNETIIPRRFREGHERGVRHYLATGEGPILNRRIEITALRRNGAEFPVELTVSASRWGTQVIFTSFIRDISERKRTERHLAVRYAVTRILAEAPSVGEALPSLLEAVCRALEWEMGVFWRVEPDGRALRPAHLWAVPEIGDGEFAEATRSITFAPGVGLPGRVWERGEPAWIPDVTRDANFPRLAAAARQGVHGAFAFPVRVGPEFVGVVEFFTRRVAEPDPALLSTLGAMGSDIGQFVRRRAAEEALQESEEVQRFLARVGTKLAAATPDYDATLRKVARLAVPTLADWCAVYMADGDGGIRRLEIVHTDAARAPLARELAGIPVRADGLHPAARAMRTGEPALLSEVPDDLLESITPTPRERELLRALGLHSSMGIPLMARGRTLGALTLNSAHPGYRYGARDLRVAEEFARRAALSVDNARLYAEAQEANRAKAHFLATISHELRTPLNAMIGYTDLMEAGIPEPLSDEVLQYVKRVGLSAHHLLQLIEEILAFSRLEAGREEVSSEFVEMAELLGEVRAIIEPLAAAKGLRFRVRSAAEPLRIRTDPRKVRQILLNLLGNAVKFTEAGEIRFCAEREGGSVVFRVEDTGAGIAPGHLERIFEPFWQVEQGNTRTAHGTGLGLSVTRRLADLLGGSIEVESTPGSGTCFTVRLPLAGEGAEA